MPQPILRWSQENDEIRFTLFNEMGAATPIQNWSSQVAPTTQAGLAVLLAAQQAEHGIISLDGLSLAVSQSWLSKCDEERALSLTMPPAVPYVLEVNSRGALGSALRIETRWLNDRLKIHDARIDGLIVHAMGRSYRLATPLFDIIKLVGEFNERSTTSTVEQATLLSEIQELMGIDPDHVDQSGMIKRMRIARANRFSLDFITDDRGRFQIAPIPLSVAPLKIESRESESPESPGNQAMRLLSSAEQERFVSSFGAAATAQTTYLGGDGVYVVLAPEVKKALAVVRTIQSKPVADRMAFARNPFFAIGEDARSANSPFVESRSFSDRVLGLGLLEKVVLPWQLLGSHGWLPPESVDISLAGNVIKFPAKCIEPAIVDIERAMAQNALEVTVDDVQVPATEIARDAFLAARKELDERASLESSTLIAEKSEELTGGKVGLQVRRNLDDDQYSVRRAERSMLPLAVPPLRTDLKLHQLEALAWLQDRWSAGLRGALLADDMGLGKTLSALAFMVWLNGCMKAGLIPRRPILVVAPLSLLENWESEHSRHVGEGEASFIDIIKAYGAKLPRREAGRDIDNGAAVLDANLLSNDRFGHPTAVLTTYETLRDYQQSFASIRFGLVVLDEAQRIKNPASLAWHAASALNADFWIALTGTPVENRLADLWAIADVLEPGLLGNLKEFSKTYEGSVNEASLRELKGLLEDGDGKAPPFMMRRMKEHVLLALPPKIEHLEPRNMPQLQSDAYSHAVSTAYDRNSRGQMLAVIQKLREISLHPIPPASASSDVGYIEQSARFKSLFVILDKIESAGEKALVFVDRNATESYLAMLVQRRYGLPALPPIINGEVPGKRRQALVDIFQHERGFGVMILSPKAGGVGLTITAANHVIHLSRWWNPAVEDQSTDRAYRMGQKKPVHVYYLQAICSAQTGPSFDQNLHSLLVRKRQLSRDLLWPIDSTEDDVMSLLGAAPA